MAEQTPVCTCRHDSGCSSDCAQHRIRENDLGVATSELWHPRSPAVDLSALRLERDDFARRLTEAEAERVRLRRHIQLHHCEYGESSFGCIYCPPEVPCTSCRLKQAEATLARVRKALNMLTQAVDGFLVMVKGECPSLLEENCDIERLDEARAEAWLALGASQLAALDGKE